MRVHVNVEQRKVEFFNSNAINPNIAICEGNLDCLMCDEYSLYFWICNSSCKVKLVEYTFNAN